MALIVGEDLHVAAHERLPAGNSRMPPTLWTVVLTARDLTSADAQSALAKLCEIYWYPLYAFVRRQAFDHFQAEDLTQGFFEHLFQRDWLKNVDRSKGSFRAFLLRTLCNFLNNERERHAAVKRGGRVAQFVSRNAEIANSRWANEPANTEDADTEFDRLWGKALVDKSLASAQGRISALWQNSFVRAAPRAITRAT